jgi:hypothetical protein
MALTKIKVNNLDTSVTNMVQNIVTDNSVDSADVTLIVNSNIAAKSTSDLSEGSNLYHTTARARSSISATGSLSYNSSTGIMSFTQGNTDTISEGSTNLYFTNERVDDRVSALVVGGNNITATYNDTAGTLTIDGQPGYADSDVGSYLSTNGYATSSSIIGTITDNAPGTLDTLNELAAALGDDANFSTTVTNNIATKLPLAGGAITGNVTFGDNNKAIFGAGSDLQIYHNGSHSYVSDAGGGSLVLSTNGSNVSINTDGPENMAIFRKDGSVDLFHNNSKKFETTSTGIDVTGTVTSDGLTVDNGSSGQSKITISEGGSNSRNLVLYSPAINSTNAKIAVEGTTANLDFVVNNGSQTAIRIGGSTGDISFYEDTGTTAKFFWDASAEKLGIGTTPNNKLTLSDGSTSYTGHGGGTYLEVVRGSGADAGIILNKDTGQWMMGIDNSDGTNPPLRFEYSAGGSAHAGLGNGTVGLTLNYQGNVGIGTSGPTAKLHVEGTFQVRSSSSSIFNDTNNAENVRMLVSGTHFNADGVDKDFRVESNNNTHMLFVDGGNNRVGIGVSPRSGLTLEVTGDIGQSWVDGEQFVGQQYSTGSYRMGLITDSTDRSAQLVANAGDSSGKLEFYTNGNRAGLVSSANDWTFFEGVTINENGADNDFRVESNGNTHALFLDASGEEFMLAKGVGSGATRGGIFNYGGSTRFYAFFTDTGTNANESLLYLNRQNSDGTQIQFRRGNTSKGSVETTTTGTTYNTTSDRRLKDNIEPISDATDKLMDMKPVTHTWIDSPDESQVHGFIAQEMQEVIPEAVSGDAESDEMMSMDYGRITPVIVAALQDALKEIKELKTRIDELENN